MPGLYPGSPALATRVLGRSTNHLFCDIDPESAQTLRSYTDFLAVRVAEDDGVATIALEAERAKLNPSEVLVVIDPVEPLERITPASMTSVELAGSLARNAYRVFYWYGHFDVKSLPRPNWFTFRFWERSVRMRTRQLRRAPAPAH
jgi:23S rRNA A2030 N6-methylase RlmJ